MSPHLNGWLVVRGHSSSHADIHPSSSEFLEESTVQRIRAEINDSTTYAAPFVRTSPLQRFKFFGNRSLVAQYDPSDYIILDDAGTSHWVAGDKWGNVISLTTSKPFPGVVGEPDRTLIIRIAVNLFWGSNIMTANGVILNDEMDDFSS